MQKPQIKIVFTNERLITPSGLTIVGGMLGKSSFVKQCNRIPVDKKRSEPQIKDGDILLTYIGLLCQGKTEFEAVKEMQDDPEYYKYALGIARSIPSAETLRQRMDDIGSGIRAKILKSDQKKRVKRRRIRTVIGNLILLASHVTTHARETFMALGRSNTWRFAFMQTWTRFAAA